MAVTTRVQWEYVLSNATERSGNGSFLFERNPWMQILTVVIAPLGLIGNGIILWLLLFRIQRNPFSVYILNLAGADFIFLCGTFVFEIQALTTHPHNFTFIVVLYIAFVFYFVGLSLLSAISTERCLSVLFPIWYRCRRPRHTSSAVCAFIWSLSSMFMTVYHFACNQSYFPGFCNAFLIAPIVWFFLLTPVLCVSSLTLLLRVQCSPRRRQPPRLYGLILLTVLVFLICGLPLGIQTVVPYFVFYFRYHWLPPLLACVNSSANPFIYFFLGSQRHKRGREPLSVVLQRALGDDEELEEGRRDTPHTTTREMSP